MRRVARCSAPVRTAGADIWLSVCSTLSWLASGKPAIFAHTNSAHTNSGSHQFRPIEKLPRITVGFQTDTRPSHLHQAIGPRVGDEFLHAFRPRNVAIAGIEGRARSPLGDLPGGLGKGGVRRAVPMDRRLAVNQRAAVVMLMAGENSACAGLCCNGPEAVPSVDRLGFAASSPQRVRYMPAIGERRLVHKYKNVMGLRR